MTGASSGFGRAQTEYVLEHGGVVVATLRKPEMLADLMEKFDAEHLLVLKLDVSHLDEVTNAFLKAIAAFGRIDVVFSNAGYAVTGEVEGMTDRMAKDLFDVNFWGAVKVGNEAVRVFRDVNKPPGGWLLQMSSTSGIKSFPNLGFYTASYVLISISSVVTG